MFVAVRMFGSDLERFDNSLISGDIQDEFSYYHTTRIFSRISRERLSSTSFNIVFLFLLFFHSIKVLAFLHVNVSAQWLRHIAGDSLI